MPKKLIIVFSAILLLVPKSITVELIPAAPDFFIQLISLIFILVVFSRFGNRYLLVSYTIALLFFTSYVFLGLIVYDDTESRSLLNFLYIFLLLNVLCNPFCLKEELTVKFVIWLGIGLLTPLLLYYFIIGGTYGTTDYTMSATRLAGPFGGATIVGLFGVFFLLYAIYLIVFFHASFQAILLLMISSLVILLSGSRGAILLLCLYVIPIFISKKGVVYLSFLVGTVVLVLFMSGYELRGLSTASGSDSQRLEKYTYVYDLVMDSPLGLGAFSAAPWYFNGKGSDLALAKDPHSAFLTLFIDYGVLAIPILGVILLLILRAILVYKLSSIPILVLFTYSFIGSDIYKNPSVLVVFLIVSSAFSVFNVELRRSRI